MYSHEKNAFGGFNDAKSLSTVAPFLPPEAYDLVILIRRDLNEIGDLYRGTHWHSLQISNDALNLLVSKDHVNYFEIKSDKNSSEVMLTFALEGFHALKKHELLGKISSNLLHGFHPKPEKIAHLFYDMLTNQIAFNLCDDSIMGNCTTSWRLSGEMQLLTTLRRTLAKLRCRSVQFLKFVFHNYNWSLLQFVRRGPYNFIASLYL